MTDATVIRGGTVFDGLGSPPVERDVLIRDGRIAALLDRGEVDRLGEDHPSIDARGCWVTPGFIDLHTHYDAVADRLGQRRGQLELGVVVGKSSASVVRVMVVKV